MQNTIWTIVQPRGVDHPTEIPVLKVCHLMYGTFRLTTFLSFHYSNFKNSKRIFMRSQLKQVPATVAYKMETLFMFFSLINSRWTYYKQTYSTTWLLCQEKKCCFRFVSQVNSFSESNLALQPKHFWKVPFIKWRDKDGKRKLLASSEITAMVS